VTYDENQDLLFSVMLRNAPFSLLTANVTQPGKFPWGIGFNQDVPLVVNVGQQGPGSPAVGVLAFATLDPDLRSAYLYRASLGIQRRLGQQFSVEVDYQESKGRHLQILIDQNQPAVIVRDPLRRGPIAPNEQIFPFNQFGGINQVRSIGDSVYRGVVLTAKYQSWSGPFFHGSYTFGKSSDVKSASSNAGLGETAAPADSTNVRLDRGPSSFDMRHRAVLVYIMELPVGPGHRLVGWSSGFGRQVFGGWQISGITTFQKRYAFYRDYPGVPIRAVSILVAAPPILATLTVRTSRAAARCRRTTTTRMRRSIRATSRRRSPAASERPVGISTTGPVWRITTSRWPRAFRCVRRQAPARDCSSARIFSIYSTIQTSRIQFVT
jgi:hypothetical protein